MERSANRIPLWLVASLVAASALAVCSISQRHRVEARNKAVSLATEFETIESLAASQALSVEAALDKLKLQGLTHVVLTEETIGSLESAGELMIEPGTIGGPVSSIHAVQDRIINGLRIRTGNENADFGDLSNSPEFFRAITVGLDPNDADLVKRAGLQIVGRFGNPQGLASKGVEETLEWGSALGASVFLPVGDQVLGRRDAIDATVETLERLGMLYATPEFTKIGGDANVVAEAPEIVVRLHSAQTAELDKMPYVDAVERYGRAARERNMRMLLVRPVSYSADAPLTEFGEFLKDIGDQIRREGGEVGVAKPFQSPGIPRFLPMLIALAAMPIVWFGAAAFVQRRQVLVAGAVLLAAIGLAAYTKAGLQIAALLISLFVPVAGYEALIRWADSKERKGIGSIIVGFLIVSLFSVVGGLCIAGMLNGLPFFVGAEEFRGVKLSVFLPVLLVGALFFLRTVDWRKMFNSPITWGTAALGMAILVALAVVVMRSGNDTGAGASDIELLIRNYLDRFLYVRPRTKEFLVGHPLLVIGVALLIISWARRGKDDPLTGWAILALMVSAVGQTSVVNTLTHTHIPVLLSIARVLEGLALGCIIGLALWAAISRSALGKVK